MTVDDLLEALAELKRQRPSVGMDLVEFEITDAVVHGAPIGPVYGEPSAIRALYGSVVLVDERA